MNSFGRIFRVHIFGESHGAEVGILIDGCPPGINIPTEGMFKDLQRRKGGQGKGTTPRAEKDLPIFASGVFKNMSTGAPIMIRFPNENIRSEDYDKLRSIPRPSHADWVAHQKYNGYEDYRGGGHFSARLTTGLVAAGAIAKEILRQIHIHAEVIEIGGDSNIERGLESAIAHKDSIGGLIECRITGIPVGWGEPFFDSVESYLSHIMFSIPAVKGIEFGAGFKAAQMRGLEHNDPIIDQQGHTSTNNSGGIVGGITNGNDIIFRLAIKPTASTPQTQHSLNWDTGKTEDFSIKGRHDLCVALRAPVIVEACAAIALLDLKMIYDSMQRQL